MKRIIETIKVQDEHLARAIIKGIDGTTGPRGGFYECTVNETLDRSGFLISMEIAVTEVSVPV